MSAREDSNIEALMRAADLWAAKWKQACFDNLNNGLENDEELLKEPAKHLAIELCVYSADFDGSTSGFNPESKIHCDYLVSWCQEWLDTKQQQA